MGWIRRETEKGTTQYICPNCHDYHEFREDFGEQTFSENFIFCRRCGARNGTGTAPTLTPPNEWVNRVRELDELYTKLQIVTGFTAEQLLEIFAAGYTLEKPDYSKKFAEMENLAEAAQPNEPLTLEELREMDEPVWVACKPIEGGNGYWCLCQHGHIITPAGSIYDVKEIPHWVFYRRPLEEEV